MAELTDTKLKMINMGQKLTVMWGWLLWDKTDTMLKLSYTSRNWLLQAKTILYEVGTDCYKLKLRYDAEKDYYKPKMTDTSMRYSYWRKVTYMRFLLTDTMLNLKFYEPELIVLKLILTSWN